MPRNNRRYGRERLYHIMLRGINKSVIFNDDNDRRKFLKILKDTKDKYDYKLYAYCLMNNHIHMLIFDFHNKLSQIMQSITISYATYFNKKYERVGHLFQNRFKSKCVENDIYFKSLIRYIHQNPEKAGICKTDNYKWSSYREYTTFKNIVDCDYAINIFNSINDFVLFNLNNTNNYEEDIEFEFLNSITDDVAIQIIKDKLKINDIKDISTYNVKLRNDLIKRIKSIKGLSREQICRILSISTKMYDRIK